MFRSNQSRFYTTVSAFLDDVLCPFTEEDIPQHLLLRFEEEKSVDAKKKKEKLEAHLFTELIVGFVSSQPLCLPFLMKFIFYLMFV